MQIEVFVVKTHSCPHCYYCDKILVGVPYAMEEHLFLTDLNVEDSMYSHLTAVNIVSILWWYDDTVGNKKWEKYPNDKTKFIENSGVKTNILEKLITDKNVKTRKNNFVRRWKNELERRDKDEIGWFLNCHWRKR